ncbi:MAG: phage head closure protein [Pseudomonadota bacterium]
MNLGKLDRYIRIEQKSVTNDPDFGSEVITWTTYKECWASVEDILANRQESTKTDLRLSTRPCKVQMHYDNGIDATMRIVMLDRDNRLLQIVSVPAEIGRREATEFICEEFSA